MQNLSNSLISGDMRARNNDGLLERRARLIMVINEKDCRLLHRRHALWTSQMQRVLVTATITLVLKHGLGAVVLPREVQQLGKMLMTVTI